MVSRRRLVIPATLTVVVVTGLTVECASDPERHRVLSECIPEGGTCSVGVLVCPDGGLDADAGCCRCEAFV